jgi:hypothetical protein
MPEDNHHFFTDFSSSQNNTPTSEGKGTKLLRYLPNYLPYLFCGIIIKLIQAMERIGQFLRCFILILVTVTFESLLNQFYGVSKKGMKLGGKGGSSVKISDILIPTSSDPVSSNNSYKVSLRFDWGNLDLMSPFAKEMSAHQKNCSLPIAQLQQRNTVGLGSDLHAWTQAMCNAMEMKSRLWTPTPWISVGPNGTCNGGNAQSAMNCLFPDTELRCPQDVALTSSRGSKRKTPWIPLEVGSIMLPDLWGCNQTLSRGNYTLVDVRRAGIEYLFSRITADVIYEAERYLKNMFPAGVPDNLLTVHVRWGDKIRGEMNRVSIESYTGAIQKLLKQQRPKHSPVNIFLATEDPQAVQQFREAAELLNWTVYVDPYVEEMKPFYREGLNNNPKMTKELQGRPTISALASLLVSLEANYYVLTTKSNWSRMINELRLAVIDPRCGNCTVMRDLRYNVGWR